MILKTILPILIFVGLRALAIEPQNPVSLCERFLIGAPQENCEQKMKSLNPDWYLATSCSLHFDDNLFYKCIELTKNASFSPRRLDRCSSRDLPDTDRFQCIQNAKSSRQESFQQRQPASTRKKSK